MKKAAFREKISFLAMMALTASILACSGGSGGSSGGGAATVTTADVAANYALIVQASYEDSIELAQELEDAITAFLAEPTEDNLEAARDAWLAAREPYGQTEVYRFYNGPIDGEGGPEGFINAWPLDEAYIDYVDGDADSGIVNDVSEVISEENLASLNEAVAENTIATGYHAIEFLLWGQDLNEEVGDSGERPATDYVTDGGGTNDNQDRRGDYLEAVASLLITHLEEVAAEWAADGAYFGEFTTIDADEAIGRIMLGMGSLAGGELAGERMSVALLAQDQEDEHSCFSDNTHRDIFNNFQGIVNAYEGTYTRTDGSVEGDGSGISDLIEAVDPDLNASIQAALDEAEEAIDDISDLGEAGTHFDQQIIGAEGDTNFDRIQAAIDALENFTDLLSEGADALGIDLDDLDLDGE